MSNMTNAGVATTPSTLLADALTIAPATLPRAIDVNATDDCTVDGTSVKYNTPMYSSGLYAMPTGRNATPISGNNTNVNAKIVACNRQFVNPSSASLVDNRAP